jgi:hypothetical protein
MKENYRWLYQLFVLVSILMVLIIVPLVYAPKFEKERKEKEYLQRQDSINRQVFDSVQSFLTRSDSTINSQINKVYGIRIEQIKKSVDSTLKK